ncbi:MULTISPECIES: lipoprotein-releasing ABC transporter permease subunit [Undibacterium]|uniref:Lipoprotein-releasing ABC transporter permease subunit n=1 Tax=Undibacterium aquatile TaxID=1537398 RepID=A0ABR6XDU2_9BURK|nr:lipoprotein-releasing ABC transporter permease subunit [Undibacterium aquatile]MBC3811070.1 lipoprotein-releasing ABC transporter permease subunit [Undibacterium aquatile]MBK1891659.1 lipoprotein-releasing ABC transporter permease subunit [Undibacterium sp. 14-3-2]MBY0571737.1 lipoprotein-releasing ABC transporter permease subunit [Burkholderiaceae bacterium]
MKNLSFEWLVGLRYTRAGRRSGRNSFISFISMISMFGIALGVAALIIVLSVMNGFQKEVRDRMLSVLSHIEVFDAAGSMPDWKNTALQAQKNSSVVASAPYVDGQAMIIRDDVMRGVILRGVLPDQEPKVSEVATKIKVGRWEDLRPGEFNIILGTALASSLHVRVGDKVTLAAPEGQMTPAGMVPRLKAFNVVGIFDAGHYEFDSGMGFMQIEDAQKFFRLSAPSGLRLRIKDMLKAPQVALELSQTLTGDLLIRDWSQQNRNYFSAVKTEKTMMFIILALIVAVAAFNLVSTLVMTVTDKQADIAILRTLGASPGSIMKIFMIQGGLVGLIGTGLGVALGVLVALNIDVIVPAIEHLLGVNFLPKDLYFISALPSDLRWADVWQISSMAVVLAFAATIYPSWRAACVKPAEALRYE